MTIDELRKLVSYDPATGKLTRLVANSWNARDGGNSAGYRTIAIAGRRICSHRVAWALHYGEWPKGQIDHANGDGRDNRISNLRLATNAENSRNMIKAKGASGYRGVSSNRGFGWMAKIRIDGKQTYLGTYPTPEEAAEVYRKASIEHHGEFSPFVTGRAA